MENLFPIYRAAKPGMDGKFIEYKETRRPPGNVPYIVDNLWEWVRPEGYPNRRYSAYASPTKELAIKAAGDGSYAYQVNFQGRFLLCQVKGYEDSKYHPECRELRRAIFQKIGPEWPGDPLRRKVGLEGCGGTGKLFIPCLTKEEVEQIFQDNDLLRALKDDIRQSIKYWESIQLINPGEELPDPVGEIFFQAFDGYYLREL
jgi:hypothetical protein